jgi:hypothetical protein
MACGDVVLFFLFHFIPFLLHVAQLARSGDSINLFNSNYFSFHFFAGLIKYVSISLVMMSFSCFIMIFDPLETLIDSVNRKNLCSRTIVTHLFLAASHNETWKFSVLRLGEATVRSNYEAVPV